MIHRTSNLALAASLRLEGFRHSGMELVDRNVAWIFDLDGDGLGVVEDFEAGQLEVEPVGFTKSLKVVRDEMYEFLENS